MATNNTISLTVPQSEVWSQFHQGCLYPVARGLFLRLQAASLYLCFCYHISSNSHSPASPAMLEVHPDIPGWPLPVTTLIFITSAKSLLPGKVTYSQVSGIGCRHLMGGIILGTTHVKSWNSAQHVLNTHMPCAVTSSFYQNAEIPVLSNRLGKFSANLPGKGFHVLCNIPVTYLLFL